MSSPETTPAPTIALASLPRRGRAHLHTDPDGRLSIHGSHALAILHLIEQQGHVEIRVTAGEAQILRRWPRASLRLPLAGTQPQQWAEAAVLLLRQGPPPQRMPGWPLLVMLLMLLLAFALGFFSMQWLFGS